jgi:uncharacterized protein (DUF433 family)
MIQPLAFTSQQVRTLTGLSEHQLRYWDRTGFFSPQFPGEGGRPFDRLYSFRDVVGLRTVAQLRGRVPLQGLRRIGQWLHERYDSPWSSLTFYIAGDRVYFSDPSTGARVATNPEGQIAQPFEMEAVAREVSSAVERMQRRGADEIGRIERRKYVSGNRPVLAGTRIPTRAIREFHDAGYSTEAILREYPDLTEQDVRGALAFEDESRRKRAG